MALPRLPRRSFLSGALAAVPAGFALAPRPAEGREVYVYDGPQLARALGEAAPGDRILLAGGTYRGDFTARRPGAAEAPVVGAAAPTPGATITGMLDLRAADVAAEGLVVRRGIELRGDRGRATRCRVDDSRNEFAVNVSGGAGGVVEFCELTNFRGRAVDIRGGASGPVVRRNWVHGQARGRH